MGYAYYKCKNEQNKGLVIWVHGIGEGGTDTTIDLYGNKVTALANTTIQNDLNNNLIFLLSNAQLIGEIEQKKKKNNLLHLVTILKYLKV